MDDGRRYGIQPPFCQQSSAHVIQFNSVFYTRVLDRRQATTYRLCQSITATR